MNEVEETVNARGKRLLDELDNVDESNCDKISHLLTEFRILTREKTLEHGLLDKKCLKSLVDFSKGCQTEAQKCLSNLILNYGHLREDLVGLYTDCVRNRFHDVIHDQYSPSNKLNLKTKQLCEVLYYDLRIIFLLSALCPNSRPGIRDQLADLVLQLTEKEADNITQDNYLLVIESLKTLFNLTLDKCVNKDLAGEVITKLFEVVGSDREVTHDSESQTKLDLTDQLLVNLIHLLTNMPAEVYLKLSDEDVNKILSHLDNQLKSFSKQSFRDTILPVLNVCANICKFKEDVRKRWFDEIVGSATDFDKRPEEYDTLRGRLVKLMTSVDVHIKDIAADFLHALCGGDTEKFITYTGFGNSAAFLASRGLLTQESRRRESNDRPTSSDDGSYKELRDRINPITGKLETSRKNPMDGMTEEEKEYHANELANAITKLSNLGVVMPMRLDCDGNVTDLQPKEDSNKN